MVKFYVVYDGDYTAHTDPIICISQYAPNSASINVIKGAIINDMYVSIPNDELSEYSDSTCVYFNVQNTLKKLYFLRTWECGNYDEDKCECCVKKSMLRFSKFKHLLNKAKEIIEQNHKTHTDQFLKDLSTNKRIEIGTNQCEFDIDWFEHCVTFDKRDAI